MEYFRYFPLEEYSNKMSVNILARAKVRDMIFTNSVVFYPYVIEDGDRPDVIAHKYYGSVNHTWLVFYANNITDPIYDWPFNHWELNSVIAKKYGSLAAAKQQVKHYKNADNLIVDETTYLSLPANERSVVYAYDYEVEANEAKRNIKLIDNNYLGRVVYELRNLFN